MSDENTENSALSLRAVARAWFLLTPQERKWVCAIAALALLGVAARYWRLRGERNETYDPPVSGSENPLPPS